ncbi:MAG: hypothetical protein V2I33_20480, partial [Kangiellaceae bacterium]|nr:hypothetical protein [Kangiellaceae bacterium]
MAKAEAGDPLSEQFLKVASALAKEALEIAQGPATVIDGITFQSLGTAARYYGRTKGLYPTDPIQAAAVEMYVDIVMHVAAGVGSAEAAEVLVSQINTMLQGSTCGLGTETPNIADALVIAALSLSVEHVKLGKQHK